MFKVYCFSIKKHFIINFFIFTEIKNIVLCIELRNKKRVRAKYKYDK
jgi:hypothetical protein